jgi:predicted secreted protein
MKKKVIIGIGIVILLTIIIFAVIYFLNKNNSHEFKISVETNGGVPVEWQYEIEDESIVEFVKKYVSEDKNKNGMVGAPMTINYVFKGLKDGTTTITFKYVSITDDTVYEEKKYIVNVWMEKNIVDVQNYDQYDN